MLRYMSNYHYHLAPCSIPLRNQRQADEMLPLKEVVEIASHNQALCLENDSLSSLVPWQRRIDVGKAVAENQNSICPSKTLLYHPF
jgi:hypothetical protein